MARLTAPFTVVCWTSDAFAPLSRGLEADCARLGYPFHRYRRPGSWTTGVQASFGHPDVVRQAVEEHDRVLFLDAECRILRPIPADWAAPLISVRRPAQKFFITYNSGTMLVDRDCLPWITAWGEVVRRWDLSGLDEADFVHWPGDLCDEIALHAALAVLGVRPRTVDLEYVDRSSDAPISRGYWSTPHTVIQHPTQHHWAEVTDPFEAKKLFWQNYAGDPEEVAALFAAGGSPLRAYGWSFDPAARTYAPTEHLAAHPRPWVAAPVELTSAQR